MKEAINSKETNKSERAGTVEKTNQVERAISQEKTSLTEREAILGEKTNKKERATPSEKTNTSERQDVLAVRMLVRAREDFQAMRKRMDNRIGRKADGTDQDVEERTFNPSDLQMFESVADSSRKQEDIIEKLLAGSTRSLVKDGIVSADYIPVLKRFPIYNEFLLQTKGVGTIAAGWIIAEYDIHKATTVSKLWQFTGLNSSKVIGKKRVENKDGSFSYVLTDKMVYGDKLTPGFVAPFNKRLRTAMVGVMADGFIKAQNKYTLEYYYPYKERLEQSEKQTLKSRNTKSEKEMMWSESSKGHRDRAAKRYMIKMFLKDLYVAWRTVEGLSVRAPYQEEYLGHKHSA